MNENRPIFAMLYDFDKTLSPRDMQEYGFIPGIKMQPEEFWAKCNEMMLRNNMDQILAYMFVMCQEAKGKLVFTRETLQALGRDVVLFDGVRTWFKRINDYAAKRGMAAKHYIISSGLKEIIEGTPIAKEIDGIFAAEFCYDGHGEPCWPAMAVNFTSKTQFLYRINKGVMDVTDNKSLNEYMPEDKRPVPFRNMVYIGDGLTDVPCMKLVRANGGHSIAVYRESKSTVNSLILQGRVDQVLKADYSKASELERAVFAYIDEASARANSIRLHLESLEQATAEMEQEKRREWEATEKR